LERSMLPFELDDRTFEFRLLSVRRRDRGGLLPHALMYAGLRWAGSRGASRLVALGRHEALALYRRVGLRPVGVSVRSGEVSYEVITATVEELSARWVAQRRLIQKLSELSDWHLPIPFIEGVAPPPVRSAL
jgi:hypothetical protein